MVASFGRLYWPRFVTRLVSVDVFRGATMAAMVIVNTPGDWSTVFPPLLHAEWHGWTPTDLIFPFFVFIVGVSIVLSARSSGSVLTILKRAAILYALGLALALYPRFDLSTVRVMGVLPRLALCYLAAALVFRAIASRPARVQGAVLFGTTLALLLGYWAVMMLVPAPGGVAGDLTPSGNIGAWLDRTIIGEEHLWRQSRTWDPEGLLSTVPAIATALTGVGAGLVLVSPLAARQRIVRLAVDGLAGVAIGLLWDRAFPINKNLWTSSYVVFTSGLASLALAAAYRIFDVSSHPALARPFVVMGRNALVLFVVSGWLVKTLILIKVRWTAGEPVTLYRALYEHVFAPLASPKVASLLFACAALALLYGLLELLYRRRVFLRA
jgi:predicted acyltransferase